MMPRFALIRLSVALSLTLLLSLSVSAGASLADQQAQQALQSSVDEILGILRDPGFSGANKAAKEAKIRTIINGIFDFTELTKRSLGVHWSKFSPEQQEEAAAAMADLLEATYIGNLQDYKNQHVQYDEVIAGARGAVEVRTTVISGSKSLPIHYRMRDADGWKIYDVVIEGISLVKNYRTQFQEIMLQGTPQELIAKIRERAASTRNAS